MNVSKRDAGVSEVISFVMILSMLIIAFSLWALYAVLAGGELYIYKNTESGINLNPDTMNTKIGRLSAQIGGTRGSTVIGYEGGGVFRSDNGNAVWLTPGLLQIYPDATQKNATVRVDLVLINMSGNSAISSNWGVPIDCAYVGSTYEITRSMNDTKLILSFQSSDTNQKNLWSSLFDEAIARYPAEVEAITKAHPETEIPEVNFKNENGILYWKLSFPVPTG